MRRFLVLATDCTFCAFQYTPLMSFCLTPTLLSSYPVSHISLTKHDEKKIISGKLRRSIPGFHLSRRQMSIFCVVYRHLVAIPVYYAWKRVRASERTDGGSSFEHHKGRILIAFCSFSSSFQDDTIKCLSSIPIPKGRDELKTFKSDETVLKRWRNRTYSVLLICCYEKMYSQANESNQQMHN